MSETHHDHDTDFDIAVVSLAGRFPGADTVEELWRHLLDGRDLVTDIDPALFTASGGDPALLEDPSLVLAEAAVEGIDLFDAEYFGYPASEARLIDPQQRLFLECAVHALEAAAYDPARRPGAVGVYAGSGQGDYHRHCVHPRLAGEPESAEAFAAAIAGLVSSLPTRTAYHLGLTGPAVAIQTACSSSLVAVHTACQDLLAHRCDTALAGGASLNPLPHRGHRYTEGGLLSPDGRCRPFSADAAGMAGGDGVGVVVLRRLADALADGDPVRAVIRGSAVNNDGSRKVGFTAPSVTGQAEAVADALAVADVAPSTIGYVEAHGTGTPVGDPIEIAALTRAFGPGLRPGGCLIGSVKGNIGHTDTAAGVIGLIKAVLCVERGTVPASLHAERTNPEIDFAEGPFRVAHRTTPWPAGRGPRRAGVSSFGIGGTNAHVILEQPPAPPAPGPRDPAPVVVLSAKTPEALDAYVDRLADHLAGPEAAGDLTDVAHTSWTGRTAHRHRWALAARDLEGFARALAAGRGERGEAARADRPVAWMFPGGGSQYPGMGAGLEKDHPVFAREMDRAARAAARAGVDLADGLRGSGGEAGAFCAVVAVEHALAVLLREHGPAPAALIGHSLGEYTAAVLAGVLALEDALALVAERGRLLERAGGASLAVPLSRERTGALLDSAHGDGLDLAAVNGPEACVVAGPADRVAALADHLADLGVPARPLRVATAVHSRVLDPVLEEYRRAVDGVALHTPALPLVTGPTGRPLTAAQAVDPGHWVRQLRSTVLFADGLARLRSDHDDPVLLEVGPGTVLSTLASDAGADAVPAMRRRSSDRDDSTVFSQALGRAWTLGAPVDPGAARRGPTPRRVPLPGYPFQRRRHWTAPPPATGPVTGFLVPDGLDDPGFTAAGALAATGAELVLTHPAPVTAAAPPAPGPAELLAAGSGPGEAAPARPENADPELDVLAAHHVLAALGRAGVPVDPGTAVRPADIDRALGVRPPYHRLTAALLDLLAASGPAERRGGLLVWTGTADPAGARARALDLHPGAAADADLIAHCADRLADVVSGRTTGVEALIPDGDAGVHHTAEDRRALGELADHRALAARAAVRLARAAGPRGLRILEIGAGRGFLTWPVAEALRGVPGVDLHATDLGRSFVLEGRREAARRGLDSVRFDVLDASRDPADQGFAPGSYDLVLAFNVLHALPDLRTGAARAVAPLRPGGTALVLELESLPGHGVLTSGLFEGMWTFDDDLRTDLPLAPARTWREALAAAGCPDTAVHRTGLPGDHHALIAARRSAGRAERRLADLTAHGGGVTVLTAPAGTLGTAPRALTPAPVPAAPSAAAPAAPDAPAPPRATHVDTRPDLEVPYTPPRDEVEEHVTAVWAEVLGLDRVGVHDDFFALGGESLLAMRAVTRVSDVLGVRVPVRSMFDDLTPARLAERVRQAGTERAPDAPVRRRGRTARRTADGSLDLAPDTRPPSADTPSTPRENEKRTHP